MGACTIMCWPLPAVPPSPSRYRISVLSPPLAPPPSSPRPTSCWAARSPPAQSADLLARAQLSWSWLQANTNMVQPRLPLQNGVDPGADDTSWGDATFDHRCRAFAAVELFEATGQAPFNTFFVRPVQPEWRVADQRHGVRREPDRLRQRQRPDLSEPRAELRVHGLRPQRPRGGRRPRRPP